MGVLMFPLKDKSGAWQDEWFLSCTIQHVYYEPTVMDVGLVTLKIEKPGKVFNDQHAAMLHQLITGTWNYPVTANQISRNGMVLDFNAHQLARQSAFGLEPEVRHSAP